MNNEQEKPPFIFEMPIDRVLSEQEMLELVGHGIKLKMITCGFCGESGWTSDEREHCSIACYCRDKGIDQKKMELIRQAVLVDNAAFREDKVQYGGKILQVVATDCSAERIKRSYHLKFNYVLRWKDQLIQVKDSETPLLRESARSFFEGEKE